MTRRVQFTFLLALSVVFSPLLTIGQDDSVGAPKPADEKTDQNFAVSTLRQTRNGLGDAALSPLEDLNLKREKIPAAIADLLSPYEPLPDFECATIGRAVRELDTLLEPDVDTQIRMAEDGRSDSKSNSEHASDFALGQIASEARSLIPFRGLVRKATGAESHDKKVELAYRTAYLRRSYLKGIGQGRGCIAPASPLPINYDAMRNNGAAIRYEADQPEEGQPINLLQRPVGSSVE